MVPEGITGVQEINVRDRLWSTLSRVLVGLGNGALAFELEQDEEGPRRFEQAMALFPGAGKSRYATEIANTLNEGGLKTLYLMLSHNAIDERLSRMGDEASHWGHWRGHLETCSTKAWTENLYAVPAHVHCDCGRPGVGTANRPTLAPLDYLFVDETGGQFSVSQVTAFDLWIIDEFDFRRTLGSKKATRTHVNDAAENHPAEPVQLLCRALCTLMDRLAPRGTFSGGGLHNRLDETLREMDSSWASLASDLRSLGSLPRERWASSLISARNQPPNFPPPLVAGLLSEHRAIYTDESPFNPTVHLTRGEGDPYLSLWWKKHLIEAEEEEVSDPDGPMTVPSLYPPVFIMDATADDLLVRKIFPSVEIERLDKEWPQNAHVFQWHASTVTRSALGLYGGSRAEEDRDRWFQRAATQLMERGLDVPIGLITHQVLEEPFKNFLETQGFTDVKTLHYFGQAGSNELKDCSCLVLLGCPIPNPRDFQEEAQAFFADEPPLEFDWEQEIRSLRMRDGDDVDVSVQGYQTDDRTKAYFSQKCQLELYQAIHRIRPFTRDEELFIYVYTNMPIPNVIVDGLLRSEAGERIASRRERAVTSLNTELDQHGECTLPRLASLITLEGEVERSVVTWINRNRPQLGEATRSRFEPGNRRRPGRFVRI